MSPGELHEILATLQALYPKRFDLPEPAMRAMWLQEFHGIDVGCARHAVQRWARQHSNGPPPTIEALRDVCDWMAEEKRRGLARQRHHTEMSLPVIETVLTEAALAERTEWAHRHVQLFFLCQGHPDDVVRHILAASICREFAQECPAEDRAAWLAEAAWYDEGASQGSQPLRRSS